MIHPLTPPEVTPQVIAVKVPFGVTSFKLNSSFKFNGISLLNSTLTFYYDPGNHQGFEHLDGYSIQDWEPIGLYSKATEEMAKKIVPYAVTGGTYNYSSRPHLEKLHELMNSKKLFLVNPYGEKEPKRGRWVEREGIDNTWNEFLSSRKWEQWQEAEKNKSDFVFLIKK